jgi:hypothetical protein
MLRLRQTGTAAEHDRISAQRHSEHRRRRVFKGRNSPGAAIRSAVRLRAAPFWRTRHAGIRLDRKDVARPVFNRRHHHEGCPDRRLRRDGLHNWQYAPTAALGNPYVHFGFEPRPSTTMPSSAARNPSKADVPRRRAHKHSDTPASWAGLHSGRIGTFLLSDLQLSEPI